MTCSPRGARQNDRIVRHRCVVCTTTSGRQRRLSPLKYRHPDDTGMILHHRLVHSGPVGRMALFCCAPSMCCTLSSAVQVRPSVVDDFIRNFLIKVGMTRTLDSFNTEWYELQTKGRLGEEDTTKVPDIYLRNEELDEQASATVCFFQRW